MIKILAIGNSFSQDATALLQLISDEIYVRNLYFGGCSLQQHCEMARKEEYCYDYQENGESCVLRGVSLSEGLRAEKWDYITVQQASGLSGIEESYYPYITER